MPDNINYTRVNWKNGAEGGTPLNDTNLNKMDSAIADLERELIAIQGSGKNSIQMEQDVETIDYTGRNPNATAIDSTITGTIEIGAKGAQTAAFGKQTTAQGSQAFAIGNKTIAKGDESLAQGYQSVTLAAGSHAEGQQTVTAGSISHAEGLSTITKGQAAHAEGYQTKAEGAYSHTEGVSTAISPLAEGAHAEGYNTKAYAVYSHAEGHSNEARGNMSHAEGYETVASEAASHSEGLKTKALGAYCHAEGKETKASGTATHTEGYNTETSAEYSHAEGYSTKAQGQASHAEGYSTKVTGLYAHSEGHSTKAKGDVSHAEGFQTVAEGLSSHSEGYYTQAVADYQHVSGTYNIGKDDTLFEIGNGDYNGRSNAFEVYKDGHVEVGVMGTTPNSVATRGYVDANAGGGTQLYKHTLLCFTYGDQPIIIISTREAPYTLNDLDGSGINDAIIMYASSGRYTTGGFFHTVYYMDDYIHAEQIIGEPIHAAIRSDGQPIEDNVVKL